MNFSYLRFWTTVKFWTFGIRHNSMLFMILGAQTWPCVFICFVLPFPSFVFCYLSVNSLQFAGSILQPAVSNQQAAASSQHCWKAEQRPGNIRHEFLGMAPALGHAQALLSDHPHNKQKRVEHTHKAEHSSVTKSPIGDMSEGLYICIYMYIHICMCTYIYIYIYIWIYIQIYIYIYIFIYIYRERYLHIYIYICIHVYI